MTSNKQQRKINTKIVKYLWCLTLIGILLLFLRTYLITNTPFESQENPSDNQQNMESVTISNLGITTDEFQDTFNKIAQQNKINLQIKALNVQKGLLQNTFQYMLTDDITIIGNVDGPNNILQKITILSTSTEAISSDSTISAVINLVIYVLNPTLTTAEHGKLHTAIGLSTGQVTGTSPIVHNGKRYFYQPSDKLGILFIISPVSF